MAKDTLTQFAQLHSALLEEKAELEARLERIIQALKLGVQPAPAASKAVKATKTVKAKVVRKKVVRAKNAFSLRQAVLKVLGNKAMTKADILASIKALGYKFTAKDPVNSLNTVLYGKKPKFKNDGGKFSA